jgi:hypothetical protein
MPPASGFDLRDRLRALRQCERAHEQVGVFLGQVVEVFKLAVAVKVQLERDDLSVLLVLDIGMQADAVQL